MSSVVIAGTPPSGDTALPVANSIDPVNDYVPIYTASATATQAINRNTYLNLSSQPVGLTDSQTLTNKTLTSPTISSPTLSGTTAGTFTLGGTITFPTSVVQLTSTQTLTNKTLTSPTINSPTITNATISADAITGYTTSGSGTIYGGISVTTGNVSLSGTLAVTGASTLTGTLTTSKFIVGMPPVWQYLGYAQSTSNFTSGGGATQTQVTGLTVTVTVPTGVTKVKITSQLANVGTSSTGYTYNGIWNGTVGSGTQVGGVSSYLTTGTNNSFLTAIAVYAPSAGSITYNIGVSSAAGQPTVTSTTTAPSFILVECC